MKIRSAELLLLSCLCVGCASGGDAKLPAGHYALYAAQSRLASMQETGKYSPAALERLIGEFDALDDYHSAWIASTLLCKREVTDAGWDAAEDSCRQALTRAGLVDSEAARFNTALQLYLYSRDPAFLQLARRHASTTDDRTLLSLAAGESTAASASLHSDPAVAARQLYAAGKARRDSDALREAYLKFLEAGDSRGLGDTLFLQAKLALDADAPDTSRRLATRSELVLSASGYPAQAEAVRNWIQRELAAD